MATKTIDQVITVLEQIKEDAKKNQNPLGYFATLYLEVTRRVKKGIGENEFEDGARMEKLDVIFANRYIDAYQAYQDNKPCSVCWEVAFDASKDGRLIVLQHLMVGINAHINLDLGVAAAETVGNGDLNALKNDFDKINTVLAELLEIVEDRLANIWRVLRFIDRVMGKLDERIGNLSIEIARINAWKVAQRMAGLEGETKVAKIKEIDEEVAILAKAAISPRGYIAIIQWIIRLTETGTIADKIGFLEGNPA